jgi:hypothetical protein
VLFKEKRLYAVHISPPFAFRISTEGHMKSTFIRTAFALAALAMASAAIAPACHAQSAAPNLDKHARKMHKLVASYSSGTYVALVLRDGSQTAGSLGAVKSASFTITNTDTNVPETHDYADVARVEKGREYIGAGSGPDHHIHWIRWSAVGVAAAGAAVAAFTVR